MSEPKPPSFREEVILPVFRSASADVCAKFYAKDMHSASRSKIENAIQERMMEVLEERGFIIEAVLLKSISLPDGLSRAIENKLEAEQVAQRMQFELQRESAEAERRVIAAEAERKTRVIAAEGAKQSAVIQAEGSKQSTVLRAQGEAEANDLIEKSISPTILKYRAIEAYGDLSRSNNAKVIITDSDSVPLLDLKP